MYSTVLRSCVLPVLSSFVGIKFTSVNNSNNFLLLKAQRGITFNYFITTITISSRDLSPGIKLDNNIIKIKN